MSALALLWAGSAAATPLSPDDTLAWYAGPAVAFLNPEGVGAGPAGNVVYVADTDNNRIVEYTSNGVFIRLWGGSGGRAGEFSRPTSVVTDPDGDVYVADSGNSRVQKFTARGAFLTSFDVPFAHDVTIGPDGRLYVLTTFFGLVAVRSPSGAQVGAWRATFPGRYFPYAGYDNPSNDATGIAADRAGRIFVAGHSRQALSSPEPDCHNVTDVNSSLDHHPYPDPLTSGEVVRFSAAGAPEAKGWLNDSPADCYHGWFSHGDPTGAAVDPNDGDVYVSQGEHFIRRLGAGLESPWAYFGPNEGHLNLPCVTCRNSSAPNFGTPSDVAFDCRSNLYVMTPDRVLKYRSPRGTPSSTCRSTFADLVVSPVLRESGSGAHPFLTAALDCQAARTCVGTVVFSARRGSHSRALLARRRFRIRARRARTLRLPVRRAARKLLARSHRLRVAAVARFRSGRTRRVRRARILLRDPSKLKLGCPAGASARAPVARAAIGARFSVSGTLSTHRAGATVDVLYTSAIGVTVRHRVRTGKRGRFRASFTPDVAGASTVVVAWPGDHGHEPTQARGCKVDVKPAASSLTIGCPGAGVVGSGAGVSGALSPAQARQPLAVTYRAPSGRIITRVAQTNSDGRYADTFVPDEGGTWTARVRWNGDGGHSGDDSSPCTFPVARLATSLTLSCPASGVRNQPSTFSGTLSPPLASRRVTIDYTSPAGPTVTHNTQTDGAGHYSDTLTPDETDNWSAQASWAGDAGHKPAESAACIVEVNSQ